MNRIRFIDRSKEIKYIKETSNLSKNKLFTLSISGLRRIGKTRLIFESLKERDIYLFVNKNKSSESLLKEYEETLRNKKILTELETLNNWDDFFSILFNRFKGIVAFDEFQNFLYVNKSVYGILQKHIDLNEHKKDIFFIFSGSLIGLVKKLFSDAKEPLYGRIKRKMTLNPLSFTDTAKMCCELKINDIREITKLYTMFGGFPKYYVSIEDENLKGSSTEKILDKFFFTENAVLEDEVSQILSLEFGRRSGLYYDILCSIANGNTRMSEISSFLRKKETDITRQINELVNYFELIGIERSITNKNKIFFIKHPLMNFWFRFFYKNLSSYKRREKWLTEKIKKEINSYTGKEFEKVCKEFLIKTYPKFERVGRWWGHHREEGKREELEIDLVALNKKQILFCECKWKDNVNAEKVLVKLKEKAKFVEQKNKRKEFYAVFAKSFKKKTREKNIYCFDLKDLEKTFLK